MKHNLQPRAAAGDRPSAPRVLPMIGLTGPAGAGKSQAVAQYLEDEYSYTSMAFADPILHMIGELFSYAGIAQAWATERELKEFPTELGFSYRHLAQTLGTEWGRNILGADLWLRTAEAAIRAHGLVGEPLVFADVRFANESAWIRARGGVVVRVQRPGVQPVRSHISETEAQSIEPDYTLRNDGTLADLHAQIDDLVKVLRHG
jgi:hypothetical protein